MGSEGNSVAPSTNGPQGSAQPLTQTRPEKLIEGMYVLADLLVDAERTLGGTYGHRGLWRSLPEDRADALEKLLGGFDFLMTSKAVRAYADAWQAEIDSMEAAQ